MGHWPCKRAPLPSTHARSYLHYTELMARERHEVHRILDLAQLFHQSDSARGTHQRKPYLLKAMGAFPLIQSDLTKFKPLHSEDGSKHLGLLWGGIFHP